MKVPQDHLPPRPPQSGRYQPDTETKRQMLINARDQFRAKGYECELNIMALEAQDADADVIKAKREDLENSRDNNYASARRMEEELRKLPKPKKEKA